MPNYDNQFAESIDYFKTEARKAFAEVCEIYGFKERKPFLRKYDNHFQIVFSNRNLKIKAEGINWGMNTEIYLKLNQKNSNWYSIRYLIQERTPGTLVTGSQTEQLYGYASYLKTNAANILAGDGSFFENLEAQLQKEKEEAEKNKQAEIHQKLAEGYKLIENPYGESILQKPRFELPSYEEAKMLFPEATEVVLAHSMETLLGKPENPYSAIIYEWYTEIGELVQENEILCSITTDKVEMDIPAPVSGQVVWLLPEGTMVQETHVLAIIL